MTLQPFNTSACRDVLLLAGENATFKALGDRNSWGDTGGLAASEKAALESKKLIFACKDLSGRSLVASLVWDLGGMKKHLPRQRTAGTTTTATTITSSIPNMHQQHRLQRNATTTIMDHNSNFNIKKQQEQQQYQQQHGSQRKRRWHRNK